MVWDTYRLTGDLDLFGQRFTASGDRIGGEFSIAENGAFWSDVSAAPDGRFVIVWIEDSPHDRNVLARIYDASGQPAGGHFLVNTHTTNWQWTPSVATQSDGSFFVSWVSQGGQDGSYDGVYGRLYDAAGTPMTSEFLINTVTNYDQRYPSVAALAGGGFVVTWWSYLQDGDGWGVYGKRYGTSGQALGSEFRVNTNTMGSQAFAEVTALESGGFVVAWKDNLKLAGQLFDPTGSPIGAEFAIGSEPGELFAPSISSTADGGFVIVWSNDQHVRSQYFTSAGQPLGAEFLPSTVSTDYQSNVDVVGLINGDVVTAWESRGSGRIGGFDGRDGDGGGIYARIFESPAIDLFGHLFANEPAAAAGVAVAYETLLGGVPTVAGFINLITNAIATNFGSYRQDVTFNEENIVINVVNGLVQYNPDAGEAFASLIAGTTTPGSKLAAIYDELVPVAKQTQAGREFFARLEAVTFYEAVAEERGVSGPDGAAIVALASLLNVLKHENIGLGNAVNDLLFAVVQGSFAVPLSGITFTPIETADGIAFDQDDGGVALQPILLAASLTVSDILFG